MMSGGVNPPRGGTQRPLNTGGTPTIGPTIPAQWENLYSARLNRQDTGTHQDTRTAVPPSDPATSCIVCQGVWLATLRPQQKTVPIYFNPCGRINCGGTMSNSYVYFHYRSNPFIFTETLLSLTKQKYFLNLNYSSWYLLNLFKFYPKCKLFYLQDHVGLMTIL